MQDAQMIKPPHRMSTVAQKAQKKRKLDEISNTKRADQASNRGKGKAMPLIDKTNVNKGINNGKGRDKSSGKGKVSEKKVNKDAKKENKKVLTNEKHEELVEERSEEIITTTDGNDVQSQVIIGNMFSLYALADKSPSKIKTIIDEIFTHQDNSEEFVIKTMFLYFLELMGLAEIATLQYDVHFIANNTDEKKLLGLFSQEEKFDVSFEKMIFFSQEKRALEQKKLLKRVCKIFIANVVDVLPDKETYLTSVIQRVCVFSKSPCRLVRYAFTYVGLYLYKFLLGQYRELFLLRSQLEEKYKNCLKLKQKEEANKANKQLSAIEDAVNIIKACIETLQKYLVLKRAEDSMLLLRKSVYEFFLQLDEKEIQIAFNQENAHQILDMIFNSLKDTEQQIKKIGLQMVSQILNKMSIDKQTSKIIEQNIMKHKHQIFKMAIPTQKHQDTTIIAKSLQVIQKMIELLPGIFNDDHLQILKNLVHYPNQSVKEEIGDLLLVLSDEFDDSNSLLELQKIHPSKNNYEEFSVNFNEEPNKSQKQLVKLIKMFEKHVQTRSQYIISEKGNKDEENFTVPNMQKDQVQKILESDCEERALLIFQTFHRKTSILYDVQSICNLLKKDDIEDEVKVVLAHILNTSLMLCYQMVNMKDNQNLIFNKFWEISTSYLKLTVINELLQTFRVENKILNPLLRVMLTIGKALEKDNNNNIDDELCKDLTMVLLKIIDKTQVTESQPETHSIIKNSILNLTQLQQYFPLMTKELQELTLNFCDQLQNQVVPQLFKSQGKIHEEAISFIFKFNILLSQVSIKQFTDSDYLKGMCSFSIVNYTQMILDNQSLVGQLSRSQLSTLIQMPFTFFEQLLNDAQQNQQHIQFQTKLVHQLMDFYLDLTLQLKVNENLQNIALQFLIESLILVGGENRTGSSTTLILGINEFPRAKEFITELIQNVAGRIKGNELIVQEQFSLLLNLFNRDVNSLLSETGVEFVINFGTSKDQNVLKEIRKLYYSYKQRDRHLMDTKKSIFYSFITKCVLTIYSFTDAKVYRLLDKAPGDVQKELNSSGFDAYNPPFTMQMYSKLSLIKVFVKNFLNSIMLLMISHKNTANNSTSNGITKQQDEFAYFKMVETLIRFALQERDNFPLLLSVKYFMHKNFLNQKQQDGTLSGLKLYLDTVKEKLQLVDNETEMLNFVVSKIEDKTTTKSVSARQKKPSANKDDLNNTSSLNESHDPTTAQQVNEEQINNDDQGNEMEEAKKDQKDDTEETKKAMGQKRKARASNNGDQKENRKEKGERQSTGQAKKMKKTK